MAIRQREDCLTGPSPRACRARQTNHSNCSLNLSRMKRLQSQYSELTPKVTVFRGQFFRRPEIPRLYLGLARD